MGLCAGAAFGCGRGCTLFEELSLGLELVLLGGGGVLLLLLLLPLCPDFDNPKCNSLFLIPFKSKSP